MEWDRWMSSFTPYFVTVKKVLDSLCSGIFCGYGRDVCGGYMEKKEILIVIERFG